MLASTIQFSHNTNHTPTTNQTSRQSPCGINKTTQLLPQTPNSAPTLQNNYLFDYTTVTHPRHHNNNNNTHERIIDLQLVCLHPETTLAVTHLATQPTKTAHNCEPTK